MIDGRQRRRFAACLDVGLAEVADHGNAGRIGESTAVEQLHRPAWDPGFGAFVQHGLAVDADSVEILYFQMIVVEEFIHRLKMQIDNGPARLVEDRRLFRPARPGERRLDRRFEHVAHRLRHRLFRPGAEGQLRLAIGIEHSHVDAVERGSGHKSQDLHGFKPFMKSSRLLLTRVPLSGQTTPSEFPNTAPRS